MLIYSGCEAKVSYKKAKLITANEPNDEEKTMRSKVQVLDVGGTPQKKLFQENPRSHGDNPVHVVPPA